MCSSQNHHPPRERYYNIYWDNNNCKQYDRIDAHAFVVGSHARSTSKLNDTLFNLKHPMCRKGSEELIFERLPQAYRFENVLYYEVENRIKIT